MKPSLPQFQKLIWEYYRKQGRPLLWRHAEHTSDPYKILVSEIMLQQTQVARVNTKYPEFIKVFPNFKTLAKASLSKVLKVWQGMGYNRRAIALQKIAIIVMKEFGGVLPSDPDVLETFPGIGPHTAGSIAAFAFNKPTVFIETNIRRVFIHFFFPRTQKVSDEAIRPLVEKTVDQKNPREWYFALMDYCAKLAKEVKNPNRKSRHYRRQVKFEGSLRQVRGAILKELLRSGGGSDEILRLRPALRDFAQDDIKRALNALVQEGFIFRKGDMYELTH